MSSKFFITCRITDFPTTRLDLIYVYGSAFLSYVVYLCNSFEVTQLSYDINLVDLHIEQHDTSLYKVTSFIPKELLPDILMEI